MRKFKNHSPENQQSDIGLNCTTKHVKRNRFYSWTKLHTLLVIFGTLIIFSGFGSLIYYFAVNAQNAIRNQDYNERFIPNEKNITPQRVKNINDSIDGLLACWENNERNIDLASAFGDELKKINENADLSDYEKYIAINETAYAYDVELIDPYLVTEMLCAKKADLVNQVANLNLSVDETNKVKEVLADKIDDYEELIGKEIFTIDDLNEQVAEDKYAALDAIKSSDESWIAENQMLESFSQSYFIDLFNNYGNKISAIKDEDAVEGISAGSVTQVIQHSNTNVTPLQITWDQLFTENNVNQYVGLVDETGQPLFTTATYAFVFPYIGIDNQLISLDLLADELIDFTDYEITAHIQAFDCDEISSESYNHNNYYDYDFSIAFALQTIAKDEFDQPRWTGEPTPYYTIQLNPSDEYERKNNAAIFEQLDFEYNINSTFDVFNIGEDGNHYDQVKILDSTDDAIVEQNGILTVKFPNYDFPTLPELRTDPNYYQTYNASEITEYFSDVAWPNSTNNLLTNENKKAICDSQYQITGKNINVIERGKNGYRIIIQNPSDYNYTITFKKNASFNLYDVGYSEKTHVDNVWPKDDEYQYTFIWNKYLLTTDYRVFNHDTGKEEKFNDSLFGRIDYRRADETRFDQYVKDGPWDSIDLKGGKLKADVIDETSSSDKETKFAAFGSIIPLDEIDTFAKVKWNGQTEYQTYANGFIPNRQLSLQIRERPNEVLNGVVDPDLIGQQLYYQWIIENNNYTNNATKFVSKINVDHSIGEPLELQLTPAEMVHNNEVYKKRIEELLQSKLVDRGQFDQYFNDNIIYHSLKIATVAADIVVTALDLAATACSFGAGAWSWAMAVSVMVADGVEVAKHAIEINSLLVQRDNLNHYLASAEYASIEELCRWIGDDKQYQSIDDLNLIKADVVDEDTETATELDFKEEYADLVNKLDDMTKEENINSGRTWKHFDDFFDGVTDGINATANITEGIWMTKKFSRGIAFLSASRAFFSFLSNDMLFSWLENTCFSWLLDFCNSIDQLLNSPIVNAISNIFNIVGFARKIKYLGLANSTINCRKRGSTLNAEFNIELFRTKGGFWIDKKPDKLGRRIKHKPHVNFKPDQARMLLKLSIIFGIISWVTDWATEKWYETSCQKDYVLTCNWEQWKKQNITHAIR